MKQKTNKNNSMSANREYPRRKKVDPLAVNKIDFVDYKDPSALRKFISETGKILPARITGLSRKNQRMITKAIKRAREIGLLPFAVKSSS